jgi:hypothetical protein
VAVFLPETPPTSEWYVVSIHLTVVPFKGVVESFVFDHAWIVLWPPAKHPVSC